MRRICVVTGSRADRGLLEWPIKTLRANGFEIEILDLWGTHFHEAGFIAKDFYVDTKPELVMVLGDRYEVLGAVTAAHLQRVPIAHIAGGDVTEGSYDDAMRDCISRMASVHFVTSTSAMARLTHMGCRNVHLVGSPGIDYIKHANWKKGRPFPEPYIVVSYQAETIDGTDEIRTLLPSLPPKFQVFIMPNPDRGSEAIRRAIVDYTECKPDMIYYDWLEHGEFLNLIFHCDEFIGNSSSMLYEAPELKVKTRMIGKRQRGRTIPMGDGLASQRIANILKYAAL